MLKKNQKQPSKIFPEGYYTSDESNPYIVRIKMGPFKGVTIQICENIKIRKDVLTGTPQLCYDYRVLQTGPFDVRECETSKILSRIIAAIAVEILSDEIHKGGIIESVQCPNQELRELS